MLVIKLLIELLLKLTKKNRLGMINLRSYYLKYPFHFIEAQ